MIHTIDGIIEAARGGTPGVIAVAAAHDQPVIQAVVEARREGIAVCLAAVFVSFAFVVKLTQPIEYRR